MPPGVIGFIDSFRLICKALKHNNNISLFQKILNADLLAVFELDNTALLRKLRQK